MTAETLSSNFYFPPSRINFVSELQVLIQQNRLIAIEGPAGIGKTVILEELLTSAMPDANKCYITAVKSINDIQVRSRVIEQLFGNVLFDPEKPLVSSFMEFNQQTQLMLVIDNAHFLSGQIIGELLQVFSELNKAGIHLAILLSFDKSVSSTLLNINSSLLSIKSVPLLSKQESYQLLAEYIDDIPAENNSRVKRWIENSAGVPIQLLAYNQESNLTLTEGSGLNVKLWGTVIVVASLVLSLALYWYRLTLVDVEEPVALTESKPVDEQVVGDWPVTAQASEQVRDISRQIATMATASPEEIMTLLSRPRQAEQALAELPGESELPIATDSLPTVTAQADRVEDMEQEGTNVPISDSAENAVKVDMGLEHSKPQVEENGSSEDNASDVLEGSDKIVQLPVDDNLVATASEQYPSIQTESLYNIDNSAFLSLPADHYVLQLTAVSSESTLSQYLLSSPVNLDSVRIYKIKRNQSDWIVVTYGLFQSIEAARMEAQRVEPNAWAKSVSVIQQQITQFNQTQSK